MVWWSAIAINQDEGFGAADRISNSSSGAQVWTRLLYNGDLAVVLYNSHSFTSVNVKVTWEEIHLPTRMSMDVRDIGAQKDEPSAAGVIQSLIHPRDVKFMRLKRRIAPFD